MTWLAFPYPEKSYQLTPVSIKKAWERLHLGDAEPLPKDNALLNAWCAFHAGDFAQALKMGEAIGINGATVANKAQCIYANYLEPDEDNKLEHYQAVIARAENQQQLQPKNPNAFYFHAYAIGRYSQGISIAKALAQGLGSKVKDSLTKTLKLAPNHADAHIAFGAYHAEIIDKVGSMIGGMTYGAKKEVGLDHFQQALALNPDSAIARIEYANGLVLLEGKKRIKEAEALYEAAAQCTAMDAMERLDVEMARAELD
jgi:tetratricopeptide (TPR) repeat protein